MFLFSLYLYLFPATKDYFFNGRRDYQDHEPRLVRLDRFDGSNFTRWQDKVLLTTLKIFYILDPTLAPLLEPQEDYKTEVAKARKKREEDELIFRAYILSALSDRLYDLYTNTDSTRNIWEALEKKYKAKEEHTKIFLISRCIHFKFFLSKVSLIVNS